MLTFNSSTLTETRMSSFRSCAKVLLTHCLLYTEIVWIFFLSGKWRKSFLPELNRTIAFKQLYSAESTCSAFSFSTCSWNIRIWSMKATTLSAAIGLAWSPAAANNGATWSGMEHWAAFNTNSSLQLSRNNATWSATCRSGKKGIFRAHSTALNNNLAASSQIFSIPIILFGCMHWPYREVGYGSARISIEIKLDKYVCPFSGSPLVSAICPGNPGCCVGGTLPLWTAEKKNFEKERMDNIRNWRRAKKEKFKLKNIHKS